jgi:hypothetical protein
MQKVLSTWESLSTQCVYQLGWWFLLQVTLEILSTSLQTGYNPECSVYSADLLKD